MGQTYETGQAAVQRKLNPRLRLTLPSPSTMILSVASIWIKRVSDELMDEAFPVPGTHGVSKDDGRYGGTSGLLPVLERVLVW
jgi:hypothetical protein